MIKKNNITLRYFLDLASSKESTSIELYRDFLRTYKKFGNIDKELKRLFQFLIREEIKHKKLIEKTKKRLGIKILRDRF